MASARAAVPLSLTRFVGRDHELAELARLVPTSRLLTLTGAGGSGKTRLAGEATARAQHVYEQILWADLAPIHEDERVIPAIGQTLGVQERGHVHTIDTIIEAIGDRRVLLVLDNCEHLVDVCAGLVETLLQHCAKLFVLATSREALGVPGETAWLVPAMREDEAVQLFVERAQAVQPSFALTPANRDAVREICRRLDGMPLAIELAAARVRVLSAQQIAERLSDAFALLGTGSRTALARQRTLRGVIDWSYALLTPDEQCLLNRLSVFAGSFSIEAVEAICTGAPLNDASVLDELAGLVDKSLVVMDVAGDDARYRLLETVRQYGAEKRRATNECDDLRRRHTDYYVSLAERAEPRLFGGAADLEVVAAITADIDNLRSAFEWCAEDPSRAAAGIRAAYALHWYWFAKGQFEEGRTRLQLAQRHAADVSIPASIRGRAMIALGHIHLWQGRPQDTLTCMQQSVDLLRSGEDAFALAYALNGAGASYYLSGDRARAEPLLAEAARLAESFPEHVLRVIIHYWIGRMRLDSGDLDGAQEAFTFAVGLGRRIRHRPAMGHPLLMVGALALTRGESRAAHQAFVEALEVLHAIGDVWGIAQGLEGVACALHGAQVADSAEVILAAADALRDRIAAPNMPSEAARIAGILRGLEHELGRRFEDLWSTGRALGVDAAVTLARGTPWPGDRAVVSESAVDTATGTPAIEAPTVYSSPGPDHDDDRAAVATMAPPADLSLRVLGPFDVRVRGESVSGQAWGSARSRELLLFLVCHAHGVTKDQVGLAFWPDASPAQVRNTFHVTLHRLRKALGHPEWIVVQQDRYRLDPSLTIVCDALSFEQEMTAALRLVKRRDDGAAAALTNALALYGQDLLAGESVGEWHVPMHDQLQRLYFDGLQALATLQMQSGEFGDAIATARRLLAADTLDEGAWRLIMTAHARAGERAQALRVFQQVRELIEKELESTPDRETVRLAEKIQRGESV